MFSMFSVLDVVYVAIRKLYFRPRMKYLPHLRFRLSGIHAHLSNA